MPPFHRLVERRGSRNQDLSSRLRHENPIIDRSLTYDLSSPAATQPARSHACTRYPILPPQIRSKLDVGWPRHALRFAPCIPKQDSNPYPPSTCHRNHVTRRCAVVAFRMRLKSRASWHIEAREAFSEASMLKSPISVLGRAPETPRCKIFECSFLSTRSSSRPALFAPWRRARRV